jgi:crossover junction endodeoxyribonuclease RuvC
MATHPTCICDIDPGITGGLAFYMPDRPDLIGAEDLPVVGGELDAATLARRIEEMAPALVILERVSAMPGQGVASTFKFGAAFGTIKGVTAALKVPLHIVSPTVWKKHFRLGADKDEARALALRLWPASIHFSRKRDHNRAEAALLARFGAEVVMTAERRRAPNDHASH